MVQKRELVDLAIKRVHCIIHLGDGQAKFLEPNLRKFKSRSYSKRSNNFFF